MTPWENTNAGSCLTLNKGIRKAKALKKNHGDQNNDLIIIMAGWKVKRSVQDYIRHFECNFEIINCFLFD